MKIRTDTITRTAMFSALVVVLDYTMKFSGLKIPFPWLPFLKFDLTGVPVMISTLTDGLKPGTFTSMIAFLAILVRSGDFVGAWMKASAEFSTALGFHIGRKILKPKLSLAVAYLLGFAIRIVVMFVQTIPVFTAYYGMPLNVTLAISPLVAVFNLIQGSITIFGGILIYESFKKRVPSMIPERKQK